MGSIFDYLRLHFELWEFILERQGDMLERRMVILELRMVFLETRGVIPDKLLIAKMD